MPIYHKAPPSVVGNHATSEIDNHTSEAAKVKRTREHAYFNSYDFDAIEVLPYDDDDEEEERAAGAGKKKSSKQSLNTSNSITTSKASTLAATNSQKPLKSKQTHSQKHLSQTRQHLKQQQQQQPPMYSYPSQPQHQQQQQHQRQPQHSKTSSNHSLNGGNGKALSSNSDNFIVDNRSHHPGGGVVGKASNSKTNSYLQRFGVALFGGGIGNGSAASNNNKSSSQHQSSSTTSTSSMSSSSSSSSTTSTSSSLTADDDNNKHLKGISSELSTTTMRGSAAAKSAATSTAAAANDNLNGSHGGGGGVNGHRDVAAKGSLLDSCVVGVVNETTNALAAVTQTTNSAAAAAALAVGCNAGAAANVVSAVTSSTAAAAAASADGNFLLPRAMLKYQSTLNGNSGYVAATTTSMPMSAAANNAIDAVATTNTGSSAACNMNKVTDGFPLPGGSNANNSRLKKHSTASSSLSSLGSEEIVEVHHADIDPEGGPKARKDFKVLPKLSSGKTPGRAASHQSHYSTDKSASSGYYSSNVCSTYSLEEHIYSEPTIEVKEKPLLSHKESINGGGCGGGSNIIGSNATTNKKPAVEDVLPHATLAATGETCSGSVMRTLDYNRRYRYTDHNEDNVDNNQQTLPAKRASNEFNENLRILETSIENLDRHLKSFPGVISSQDAIVASYASQNPYQSEKMRSYAHLPTIREGYDSTAKRVWREDPLTDDSLMDIDLDSFLLDDTKGKHSSRNRSAKGIDNPSFLTEELEENHYKCAKYINSCPEDAYRVESDIIAPTRSSISEQSVAVSVDLYPKRYEDQIHFQNTRELLEDVRDKIRLLTLSQDHAQELAVSHKAEQPALEEFIPKELNAMISTLKRELELYLERMNQHSELEIRQLCTGLVKNQHIVKMKNAFERRRSLTDASELPISSYETFQGEMKALSGVPFSIRQQITTIKCSSDPNFKMKRKSLTEVFPISECYIETLALEPDNNPPLPPLPMGGTQLQRNLNFHQPSIQQFESKADSKSDSARGSGSSARGASGANDSSESNDKDSILDWHRKKPSIWEMYYGTNRIQQSLLGGNGKKNGMMVTSTSNSTSTPSPMCYPSSRPESDFTLDLPRAEQLRIKMEKEKKFRQRCRVITTFLSLVFFLLTVMVVSLVLTRGKRMFGSMI